MPIETFFPTRGLRKCNSLSPYHFVLVSEILSRGLLNLERRKRNVTSRITKIAPDFNHLLYVDDHMVFGKVDMD